MNVGFLITAYKHLELVEQNINNIQQYQYLADSPIVIVTTSEEDIGFSSLEKKYKNVYVINFNNAPKYEEIGFKNTLPLYGVSLAKRIFLSIEKGLKKHNDLKTDICVHLHSDSFWKKEFESNLILYCNDVYNNNILFSGDLCIEDNSSPITNSTHFHPEGLIINISEAIKWNFINLNRIWNDNTFDSHNFGSVEALIGQFAAYCVTRQLITSNIVINDEYYKKVKARYTRPYHGEFCDGFVNLQITQR